MMADQTYSSETKRIKIWLDADLIEWFKAQQGGARDYQTAINAALRKVVDGEGVGVRIEFTVTLIDRNW